MKSFKVNMTDEMYGEISKMAYHKKICNQFCPEIDAIDLLALYIMKAFEDDDKEIDLLTVKQGREKRK